MILPREPTPSQALIDQCRSFGWNAPGTWQPPQERPKRAYSRKRPEVRLWLTPDIVDAYATLIWGPRAGRHLDVRLQFSIETGRRDWVGQSYDKSNDRWHMARGYRRDLERGIVGDTQLAGTPAAEVRSFCLRSSGGSIVDLEVGLDALGLTRHDAALHGAPGGPLWAWVQLGAPVGAAQLGAALRARLASCGVRGVQAWPDGPASAVLPCSRESDWLDWETGEVLYVRPWRGDLRADRRRQLETWVIDADARIVSPDRVAGFANDLASLRCDNHSNYVQGGAAEIHGGSSELERVWSQGPDEGMRHRQVTRLVPWLMGGGTAADMIGDEIEAWWRRTGGGGSKLVGEVGLEASARIVRRDAEGFAAKLAVTGVEPRNSLGNKKRLGRREEREIYRRIKALGFDDRRDEIVDAIRWLMPQGRVGAPVRVHHTKWIRWAGKLGRRGYQDLRDDVIAVLRGGKVGGYQVGVRSQAWVWPPMSREKLERPGLVSRREVATMTWNLVVIDLPGGPRASFLVERSTGPPWDPIQVDPGPAHFARL